MNFRSVILFLLVSVSCSLVFAQRKSPTHSSQHPRPVTNIRQIDFKNFTYYPQECSDYGLPAKIRVRNGEYKQGKDQDEAYFSAISKSEWFGDLTGDGREEAIVTLVCGYTSGNGWSEELLVYGLEEAHPTLLARLGWTKLDRDYRRALQDPQAGIWRITNDGIKIVGRTIVIESYADGSHAMPDYIVTMKYQLAHGQLQLIGRPERRRSQE